MQKHKESNLEKQLSIKESFKIESIVNSIIKEKWEFISEHIRVVLLGLITHLIKIQVFIQMLNG